MPKSWPGTKGPCEARRGGVCVGQEGVWPRPHLQLNEGEQAERGNGALVGAPGARAGSHDGQALGHLERGGWVGGGGCTCAQLAAPERPLCQSAYLRLCRVADALDELCHSALRGPDPLPADVEGGGAFVALGPQRRIKQPGRGGGECCCCAWSLCGQG